MLIRTPEGLDLDLDALRLTEAQRQAMRIDRHVVVSAGAGSGKTHTLAWRYVRLLLTHASSGADDVEAVVVLTFTEKAAEEMTSRCHTRLLAVARACREVDPEIARRLEHMVDRFEHARIGTFHGFCARILREAPVLAGVASDLEILEGNEGNALRHQAADDAVLDWAQTNDPRLGTLLDAFGSRRSLSEGVRCALDGGPDVEHALLAHRDGTRTLDLDPFRERTEAARTWLTQTGIPTLRALERLVRMGGSPFAAELSQHLTPPSPQPLVLHRQLQGVLGALLTDRGELRSLGHHTVVGSKAQWGDPRRYAKAKAALAVLADRCADWPERHRAARELPTQADARLFEVLPHFAALAQEARESLTEVLSTRRVLDFDALQDRAVRAVVTNESLRTALRKRHRWLMVDEFQDTDSRQWAMVRALGDAGPGESADRVFLVGDVKQAIYGFRGGEVELFAHAATHLEADPITLPENFRSRPGLVDWFNWMFPRVLPTMWAPMVAARPAAEGRVTWLEAKGATDQAQAVAGWLRTQLDTLEPYEGGPPVAILLRTRTHLGTWESTLRRAGIAYRVGHGVGFWERLEIRDVVVVLHAAVTRDRLSRVGALRVPWLGGSEQDVQDLVLDERPHPALERLDALARRRHESTIADFVQTILKAFDARSWWNADARANVDLLLETVRSWASDGVNLMEITRRLVDRVQQVPRETEASPGAHTAQVVLLTVHASKGLEFPVVVVPELERQPSGRSAALAVGTVDGDVRLAFRVDDVEAPVQSHTRPAILDTLRAQLRDREHAEYRRLLYVAATRARDQLVLVGPEKAPERSWAGLLDDLPADTERPDLVTPEAEDDRSPSRMRWAVRQLAPVPAPAEVPVSASSLLGFEACASRWYRTHRLQQTPPDDDRQRELAGIRGQVLHGLIEDRVLEDRDTARARWNHGVRWVRATDGERESGWPPLDRHRRACAASPRLRELLDAPGFDELAIRTPFPGGVFVGRIDRLVLDRERQGFVVVDYKSEAIGISPAAAAQKHESQLLAYAWAAQQVLEAHEQPPVVGGEVFFTATGRSHSLGPWSAADLQTLPARLTRVTQVGSLEESMAVAAEQSPACGTCPFHGAACPGVGSPQPGLFG